MVVDFPCQRRWNPSNETELSRRNAGLGDQCGWIDLDVKKGNRWLIEFTQGTLVPKK